MAAIKQRINDDVKIAMRNQDKERLATLRFIMAAIKQKEVDGGIELDATQILAVLDKLAKQYRDSIAQFQAAGRSDLVVKETRELEIVQSYLPAQLTEDEIRQLVQQAIQETGAAGMQDMGKVMALLKPKLQGRADMGKISGLVKQALT